MGPLGQENEGIKFGAKSRRGGGQGGAIIGCVVLGQGEPWNLCTLAANSPKSKPKNILQRNFQST